MKKRIIGLDILRVLGIFDILLYHFVVGYLNGGGPDSLMKSSLYITDSLARLVCIQLFIISGFALMYNQEDKLPIGKYYKRRFTGLMLPFYTAWVVMFLLVFLFMKQVIGQGVETYKLIYTVLGIDGMMNYTRPTFYFVGEWFMSVMVICYVFYPLLVKLLDGITRYITLGVLAVVNLVIFYIHNPFQISPLVNPVSLMLYFYTGMVMARLFAENPVKKQLKITSILLSIVILILFIINGYVFTIPYFTAAREAVCYVWSITLILALKDLEIAPQKRIYKTLIYLSAISWTMILTHHQIIVLVLNFFPANTYDRRNILALFLWCIIFSWLTAYIVRKIVAVIRGKN